ncbi:oxidoreductase [Actinomycetospora sp. NBRC 106378]|nr:oxidoreductase [Actinomycetospora sp. NBRC 106378]
MPPPHAGPGRIRIAVAAAGVNALEWKLRAGQLRDVRPLELPSGTGGDAAGRVDEVGEGVTDVVPGDTVFGSGTDTYAEHAVLTSWAPVPPGASVVEAAGWPTPFETGLRVLEVLTAPPGATVVVNGAAGGVGSVVVQVARARGVRVVGVAGADNQDHLAALGAVPTTYGPGLRERVAALAPDGVDAAFDVAGSGVIPELVALTGDPSRVVSIADFSAPRYGALVSTGVGSDRAAALREGARLVAAGSLVLPVTATYPLDGAAAAQRRSATGHGRGRLVVTVP